MESSDTKHTASECLNSAGGVAINDVHYRLWCFEKLMFVYMEVGDERFETGDVLLINMTENYVKTVLAIKVFIVLFEPKLREFFV